MMRYVVITLAAVVLLLIQSAHCKKEKGGLCFYSSVAERGGGACLPGTLHAVQLDGLYPFLIAAGCLLFSVCRAAERR